MRQNRDLRKLLVSCSCLYFMVVITVGNAHEAVLALMSFDSAEEHRSLLSFR